MDDVPRIEALSRAVASSLGAEGHGMSRDGLSIGYRVGWRLRKLAMTFFGPAQLNSDQDPMAKLQAEREAKIAEARAKRASSGS